MTTTDLALSMPTTPGVNRESRWMNDRPLRQCVELALSNYFNRLEGFDPVNLYAMVLEEIEMPLFKAIMQHVKGNQSRASLLLGISRSTLRKKLQQYNIPSQKGTG